MTRYHAMHHCAMFLSTALALLLPVIFTSATYFEALDDSILHKINWAGAIPDDKPLDASLNTIVMTTARNEKYKCILPKPQDTSKDDGNAYAGPNPFELISPLFTQFVCTFKLETYWTYELCHGKYIRQYHEEREGKKVKLQEYYLGRWDKEDLNTAKVKLVTDFSNPDYKSQLPIKRIEGVNMPALQLNMSDGTLCDLNGQPRNTRVMYVCDARGKHELYSLEEVSTCEYEIVVLSPLLCEHPDFRSKETGENIISCHALDSAPPAPKALSELDNESFKMRHEHLLVQLNLESLLETKLKSESKPIELLSDEDLPKKTVKPIFYDNSFLNSFLAGKECLTGGSHWWKFEFCFGKHVLQYHEEHEGGSRTQIMLGKWDEEKHKEWSDKNPHKKPTVTTLKKMIYHYYTGGAQCDHTGQPRTVEVKFRCVDHPSPSAVSLYLMEPKTCEYALTVESGLFCPLLKTATSDYGLIDTSEFVRSKSSYKNSAASKLQQKKLKTAEEGDLSLTDDDVQPGGWA